MDEKICKYLWWEGKKKAKTKSKTGFTEYPELLFWCTWSKCNVAVVMRIMKNKSITWIMKRRRQSIEVLFHFTIHLDGIRSSNKWQKKVLVHIIVLVSKRNWLLRKEMKIYEADENNYFHYRSNMVFELSHQLDSSTSLSDCVIDFGEFEMTSLWHITNCFFSEIQFFVPLWNNKWRSSSFKLHKICMKLWGRNWLCQRCKQKDVSIWKSFQFLHLWNFGWSENYIWGDPFLLELSPISDPDKQGMGSSCRTWDCRNFFLFFLCVKKDGLTLRKIIENDKSLGSQCYDWSFGSWRKLPD